MTEKLDAVAIGALADRGADLNQPRVTVHYIYVPDSKAARSLAATLPRAERRAEPRRVGEEWAVVVSQTMVVNPDTIARVRRELEAAAATVGGDYDGWEAAVD